MNQENIRTKKRRPIIALLLSLVFPGLGHLYAGSLGASLGWFAGYLIVINSLFALLIFWNVAPLNIILPIIGFIVFYLINMISAYRLASRQPEEYILRPINKISIYTILLISYELVSMFTWPAFGNYEAYKMPSQSMMNTLYVIDYLIAEHNAYQDESPQRNDLIIFIFPRDGQTKYIKRVIGLPGDKVEMVDKKLYINNSPFKEPETIIYTDTLPDGSPHIQPRRNGMDSRDNFGPFVIPAKSYFVLGDNRDNSYDSRYWGIVPHDLLIGQAIRITYSGDWSRIGKKIE